MKIQKLLDEQNVIYIDNIKYCRRRSLLEIDLLNNPIEQYVACVLAFEGIIELSEEKEEVVHDCIDSILGIEEEKKGWYFRYSIQTEQRYITLTTTQEAVVVDA